MRVRYLNIISAYTAHVVVCTETSSVSVLSTSDLGPGASTPAQLIGTASKKPRLNHVVRAALNLHGTRSVQKLVEVCRLPEEVELLVKALLHWVVHLATDSNGNHVVQVRGKAWPWGMAWADELWGLAVCYDWARCTGSEFSNHTT